MMKALVYAGPGKKEVREVEKPRIIHDSDAVVKLTKTTICGTDLHILGGDVPACKEGTILGHLIDGTQAEYVHIPHADNSLYHIPKGMSDEAAVMISDILPTGFEIGVLNGQVSPGDTIAIVGAGPIGLSVLLTSQFYSPATIIMVDLDENRLQEAKRFGATHTVVSKDGTSAIQQIMDITGGRGVDVAIEAVGYPATFDICQNILTPGGHLANIGVHGKPVDLQLQDLWIRNVTITTGLVSTNSTPMLLKTLANGKIDVEELVTHTYSFDHILEAYDTFKNAAKEKALKIMIDF